MNKKDARRLRRYCRKERVFCLFYIDDDGSENLLGIFTSYYLAHTERKKLIEMSYWSENDLTVKRRPVNQLIR